MASALARGRAVGWVSAGADEVLRSWHPMPLCNAFTVSRLLPANPRCQATRPGRYASSLTADLPSDGGDSTPLMRKLVATFERN